ncbi:c50 carotenoid epsilon cyclase [Arthrobacter crystallopoietes BAB-32]|uniref:C50 carotenoid epsilon cyclase n=1 Tax=Arthrobacter crystallopoietes BAB-32 TaxID=1246476 RepID=N1UQI4_9MICC|nr:lycopene cyclase domain-containing protein [Arthrobacter crystallopoietes]EMY32651.1 c50 carotenoid epsilon cyclase [Arthrobacter crystallopoietes BAB-32]
MTGLFYLAALLVSLAGMAVLDWRLRLFFRTAPLRAAVVLLAGLAFFLTWDLAGIALGIFYRGQTEFMTGILLAPELPLEEAVFLTFLCYLTMNLYLLVRRRLDTGSFRPDARAGRREEAARR